MARKKHTRFTIRFGHLAILVFVIFAGIGRVWYQSRAVPDLPEQSYEMTALPEDVKNILGMETNPFHLEVPLRVPILLYHYVEYVKDDPERAKLTTAPSTLVSEIETLKSEGYTFITPSDLSLALEGVIRIPLKSVILSFDDGYMDFYTDVFPILEREQVKAVAYIVPNFLDRPNYMFTYQLKIIAESPLVEIGAHTMDHVWLKGMNQKQAVYEISESRKRLQGLLGLPINTFAYPYGAFDVPTIQMVKDAGFTNAVSTVPGIVQTREGEYFLYRLRPGGRSGKTLLKYLQQITFQAY